MRNAANDQGKPMIVIAMRPAATAQATAAGRPPEISHRMLNRSASGEMGGAFLWSAAVPWHLD
jgi:hypothetical protein